jgi:hypothetical protein
LMQFILVEENDAGKMKSWEDDFRHIYAYLTSLQPPKFPGTVDADLARSGHKVFLENCADCHGTYATDDGPDVVAYYPNRRVPLEEVGTDPVRLGALKPSDREKYADSWFADYGQQRTTIDPSGYVAPPLDGVWATAPYFHNGSVPTLWQVLNSDQRSVIWKHRREVEEDPRSLFDFEQVGLAVDECDEEISTESLRPANRYEVFDTRKFGKSRLGHTYPDALTIDDKRALLEYLKTL